MYDDIVYIDIKKPENKTNKRLKILCQFEEGGMSLIMEAVDTNLMRRMAMKVLKDDMIKDKYEISRMVFEAILTGKPRSASVEAIDNVTVAVVRKHYFEEELDPGNWLAPFIRTLAERFLEADQRARD